MPVNQDQLPQQLNLLSSKKEKMKSSISIFAFGFWGIALFLTLICPDAKAQQPCQPPIFINYVNGIVPPGQANPAQLRVMGRTTGSGCRNNTVVVKTNMTAQSAPIPISTATGHFAVTLPLISSAQCGADIIVEAWCYPDSTCKLVERHTLKCCELTTLFFDAKVLPGSLEPTHIRVQGAMLGCSGDKVVVSSSVAGQSLPISIDSLYGSFWADLPVSPLSTVKCDDRIKVKAWCAQDPACFAEIEDTLRCYQCFRAKVSYTTTQCSGTPPKQPVTLHAIISIPANETQKLAWDYGDGKFGQIFTINNVGGTATKQYSHSEPPHLYAPGSYIAKLFVPSTECDTISLPIRVICQTDCPSATVIKTAESATCINGKRTVTLEATVTAPQNSPAVGQWSYGPTLGQSIFVNSGQTQTTTTTFDYAPGSNTACIKWNPQAHDTALCKEACATFSVSNCPPPSCEVLLDYSPNPLPCLSGGGSLKVDFEAKLKPANPAYTGPFTWEIKQGGASLKKVTQNKAALPNPEKFSHTFTKSGAYEVTVAILTPEPCKDPVATSTVYFQIEDCCPKFSGTLSANQEATPCEWKFLAQVSNPQQAQLSFEWDFGDGKTQTTTPAGPPQATTIAEARHTYTTSGQKHVTVTLKASNCTETLSANIDVACQLDIEPPTVTTNCGLNVGTPGTITVTFSEDVDKASAENPANFEITVNGTVRTPNALSYDPATTTTTITGIAIAPGDAVTITVTNVRDIAGNTIVANGQTNVANCSAPSSPSPPTPSCSFWCILAGIFLIAIPISAHISTVAHCLLDPLLAALAAAAIGATIAFFVALCGVCCLWPFLIAGCVLGVIATAIYSYWGGFPQCWQVGLVALAGYVASAIGFGLACALGA